MLESFRDVLADSPEAEHHCDCSRWVPHAPDATAALCIPLLLGRLRHERAMLGVLRALPLQFWHVSDQRVAKPADSAHSVHFGDKRRHAVRARRLASLLVGRPAVEPGASQNCPALGAAGAWEVRG
eukprot:5243574-Pyramimonas_sp.AAC.1